MGVLDWMDENPADGRPWIGLVMIRRDRRRRGLASEAVTALLARLPPPVRMGVIARDDAGRAFARHLGCEQVASVDKRMNAPEQVLVYEFPSASAAK